MVMVGGYCTVLCRGLGAWCGENGRGNVCRVFWGKALGFWGMGDEMGIRVDVGI